MAVSGPVLALFGAAALLAPCALAASEEEPRDEWPTLQGDAGRTGVRGDVDGPGTGETIWRFLTERINVVPSPAVVDGHVYIGASDKHLYALNAQTGKLAWAYETDGGVYASAVVVNGTVYVTSGSVDAQRDDVDLYALDAERGTLKWRVPVLGTFGSTPTVGDGVIYLGSTSGFLYALDAETGNLVWTFEADKSLSKTAGAITGAPLLLNGNLFFGTTNRQVYAVRAENGTLAWKVRLDEDVVGSAATDGQRVFVTGDFGTLYALNSQDGAILWTHLAQIGTDSAPSVRRATVYRAGRDGLFALGAATGEVLWRNANTTTAAEHVAVSDTTVFLTDIDGHVSAVDAATGKLHWRRLIAAFIDSSPVVVDGMLYVGSRQFYVFAIDAGAGAEPLPSAQSPPPSEETDMPAPSGLSSLLAALIFSVAYGANRRRRGRSGRARGSRLTSVRRAFQEPIRHE